MRPIIDAFRATSVDRNAIILTPAAISIRPCSWNHELVNPIVKNVIAVVCGFAAGSVVNIALVNVGPFVIPLPEGADVSTMDGLKASMPLFKPANFLFPFLGHALGTFVGAFVAAKLAASHAMKLALGIGAFFLLGGIAAINMLGGPAWFNAADLLLAYIPMGYFGGMLGRSRPDSGTAAEDAPGDSPTAAAGSS